jgi:hypothetical protein
LPQTARPLQPGRDDRAITAEELARPTVHRLALEAWSGKRKTVAADVPGAYRYEGRRRGDSAS